MHKQTHNPISPSLKQTTMSLKFSPSNSLQAMKFDNASRIHSLTSFDLRRSFNGAVRFLERGAGPGGGGLVIVNASKQDRPREAVFNPFEEVKKELRLVAAVSHASLARHMFKDACEFAINEQINVEYNISYVYHAMYAYFDRDNVALKGIAKFFKDSSEEERQHAEKLMDYQNKRGGKVLLQTLPMPLSDFDHQEKGDALYAMELALSLEKLTNEKLLNLHKVADEHNDTQLTDFIESEFLAEQVESIKKISEYVAQLRRVGKGHGVWHFDKMLINGNVAA